MLYDTHSHPYLAKDLSENEILESFLNWWWKYINAIWCDIQSSKKCLEISKKFSWVYVSIGIHPTHVLEFMNSDIQVIIDELKLLYQENKERIIAIWETWLDYYWLQSLSEKYNISKEEIVALQIKYFRAQIQLAKKIKLPIIIHSRESSEHVLHVLKQENFKNFVFHCFSEDIIFAQKIIAFAPESKIWIWWTVTFKNAKNVQETVQKIDLKHIVIETDSPYLTPVPYRGKRENEPILIKEVLSKIIDLRDEKSEYITEKIFQNSVDFFWIPHW